MTRGRVAITMSRRGAELALLLVVLLSPVRAGISQSAPPVAPPGGEVPPATTLDVIKREQEIFRAILDTESAGFDEWYSPHLRDVTVSQKSRDAHAYRRAEAGVGNAELASLGGCYGACGQCAWEDPDQSPACCGVQTEAYANLTDDSNFKTCCVRDGEQNLSEEEIACRHPAGDGWAGLYEYYYPVNALEWSSTPATTTLATADIVKKCLEETDSMLSAAAGESSARYSKSTGGYRGEGAITQAINVAAMAREKRQEIARHFCMHEDQLMKLMEPEADPIQKGGARDPSLLLNAVPLWANYCPTAAKLLSNPSETALIQNLDLTPTNLFQGFLAYQREPQFCATGSATSSEQRAACLLDSRNTLATPYRMAPVVYGPLKGGDPTPYQRAVQLAIAGGYYKGEMVSGTRRYYKPYEPRPYTDQFGLFKGKRVEGGGFNELGRSCGIRGGANLSGGNHPDKLFAEASGAQAGHIYWAAFRAFATCPLGYQVWRGAHSEERGCGQEFFGGRQGTR